MKKLLLLATLLSSIFLSINVSAGGTYIVNEDGTVTFLKRVAPSMDEDGDGGTIIAPGMEEAGRVYIMNEDGTITFLNRVVPSEMALEQLQNAREEIREMEEILINRMR